jgi:hypothetical protein
VGVIVPTPALILLKKEKKMIPEFLSMLHTYGIPALIDLLADVSFIILVPAVLYYVWHQTSYYRKGE